MYLAARGWGIQPSEAWDMTISEIIAEYMVRGGSGDTYAGGMTSGDIEQIKEDSAKLRERVRARRNGAETA